MTATQENAKNIKSNFNLGSMFFMPWSSFFFVVLTLTKIYIILNCIRNNILTTPTEKKLIHPYSDVREAWERRARMHILCN